MNKILALAFAAMLFAGCKKEDPTDENTCRKPSINVSSMQAGLTAQIFSDGSNFDYYEVEYGLTGFTKGSGTTATTGEYTSLTTLPNGIYDIYGRGNCGGSDWSEWSDVESFVVTNGPVSCDAPTNLDYTFYVSNGDSLYSLYWSNPNADYSQIQYDETGFTVGAGTSITINGSSYEEGKFLRGRTYDFYVRSNCGGSTFSTWSGPSSFIAEHNVNTCLAPFDLQATRVSGGTIQYSFNTNGETGGYELYINPTGANTTSGGTLVQVSSSSGTVTVANSGFYGVYARSICGNGDKTPWSQGVAVF